MSELIRSAVSRGRRVLVSSSVVAGATLGSTLFLGLTPGMGIVPGAFALGIGALGVGATLFAANQEPESKGQSQLTPLKVATALSRDLELKLEELHGLARIYEQRNSPLFSSLNGVLTNLQELFGRMTDRIDEQSARIAAVRYTDTLSKLNEAVGRKYYLDIEAHPELWSHPNERMEAVEAALNATSEQILRHIRDLNSSRDLIYQLSLDSLMADQLEQSNLRELGIE